MAIKKALAGIALALGLSFGMAAAGLAGEAHAESAAAVHLAGGFAW